MSKQSNPVRNTLLIVGGVLGMLLLFGVVLRAALAPLYQEMAHTQTSRGSSAESGGGSYNGDDGSGSNVDANLVGVGGLLNWALGWAWGGAGWYNAGPGGGWWGGNWWHNWNGSWDRNGNWYDGNGNRVYSNETFNRTVNRNYDSTRVNHDDFGGARGDLRGDRDTSRGGGGEHSGGGEHFHGGGGGGRR